MFGYISFLTFSIEINYNISSSRLRTISVSVGVPEHPPKVKPPINVVGDVSGRIAIMVVSSLSTSDWLIATTSVHGFGNLFLGRSNR